MYKPDLNTVKTLAHGRWTDIHAALGLPRNLLDTHKHQPCPYCGGKDRFRYTDYQGNGGFICNQCTPQGGSGFDLLMLVFGYTFTESVNQVASLLGLIPAQQNQPEKIASNIPPKTSTERAQDHQAALTLLWDKSVPVSDSDAVTAYLRSRGLFVQAGISSMLRFQPEAPYWVQITDSGLKCIGHFPAMIAAVFSLDGQLQGLHLTYLKAARSTFRAKNLPANTFAKLNIRHPETGQPLPAKKMRSRLPGSLIGNAVQLFPIDQQGRLIVAEGIETAIAAHELFGLPAWACLSANGLKTFLFPDCLKELLIVADHDEPRPIGYEAAHALAIRAIKAGIKTRIWQPDYAGDALDELNRRQRPAYQIEQQLKLGKQL
ncbi:MAG: toprim domain-containing protein [Neisseria sp.]|uniref:toprim domain-containing protein n=1 Tax=Neisseria sp. TaxID=192066 RepID=UPI0026DDCB83|nr:toprim domain-containing protein [Neisseria sp.]MDO4640782.1 toprim domain-containing protein [Neisseria sp.]